NGFRLVIPAAKIITEQEKLEGALSMAATTCEGKLRDRFSVFEPNTFEEAKGKSEWEAAIKWFFSIFPAYPAYPAFFVFFAAYSVSDELKAWARRVLANIRQYSASPSWRDFLVSIRFFKIL
ncbi:hypothetical protein KI387_023292, partial [Taxus chinensis]